MQEATTRRGPNRPVVLRLILGAVVGLLFGLAATPTTADRAAAYTYDAAPLTRVEVGVSPANGGASSQVNDPAVGWVERSLVSLGTSTTPLTRSVATNTADDVLRLGTKDSWGNLNTLDDHFARHGADFGATSVDDYARQASEFFQQPGTLTKIDADGVIRVYDPATNAFGAYNPNGTTRTFFTPKRGIDYWNDQPGVAP